MTARAELLAFLGGRISATFPEINRALGTPRGQAWMEVKRATDAGLLRRDGERRKYTYSLMRGGRRLTSVFDLAFV